MLKSDTYSTPIIDIIAAWLPAISLTQRVNSLKESQLAVSEAITILGYDAPFDKEQSTIIKMLTDQCAGKIICIAAWGYYHDFKMMDASSSKFY